MNGIDVKGLITRDGSINKGVLPVVKTDRFITTDIDIESLVPSEDNFYSISDIESLKENIEEFGLQQNITVMKRSDGKYEIVSGHRRREACRLLVQEGKKKFKWIPCRILPEMTTTVKNILLITMNSETRQKTAAETTEEIARLKILYADYKKENPNFSGRIRDAIAETLGVSAATVGRHEKISKNLIPEAKEAYKAGDMSFTAAEEMAGMSAADQKAVYEDTGGKVSTEAVKKIKPEKPKKAKTDAPPKVAPEAVRNPEHGIYAIKSTMDMLEKKIAEIAELKQLDDERGNVEGSKNREAHINYLGELLEKATEDLKILEK